MRFMIARYALFFAPLFLGCAGRQSRPAPATSQLAIAESLYADLRDLRDRIDVTLASGGSGITDARPISASILGHNNLRKSLAKRLLAIDSTSLEGDDRRALRNMRRTLSQDLDSLIPPAAAGVKTAPPRPDCSYDPRTVASSHGLDSLRNRIYACYAWAQFHVTVGPTTFDRLTLLGTLARSSDPARRRQLFLALDPVWRSVNANNGPTSPYRQLIAEELKDRPGDQLPSLSQASASGVPPDSIEQWLIAMLTAWRRASPDSQIEPWDWYYRVGQASRALSPRISRHRLAQINDEVYRSLGADVKTLRIHYDVEPRPGKTPVAYTTFGKRPRFVNGGWRQGEPWIFATYRIGGLDNLNELLHETGHAVHIAAIRTRPGFADWPDSDPFTEAAADLNALDVYEPAWQERWLGDSVPLADGLRARYAGIVLDVAWALFELQMQRHPNADPNQVWTALTRDHLGIRPHPELSWWAMRGQLVDAPGYMMNYAAGAIIAAAVRARTRELRATSIAGDQTWYDWIAPRLFRFGLERSSREVIEEFLGRPVTPAAILADMERMEDYP